MAMLFYSGEVVIPIILSIVLTLLFLLLVGPFWIFYVVFRDEEKRAIEVEKFRNFSKWVSLACGIVFAMSASLLIMELGDEDYRLRLTFISIGSAVSAFFSGLISLPRWQGTLGILCFLIYCAFLIRLYDFQF